MKVEFEREGVVVEAHAGQTVYDVAEAAGVPLVRGMWPELRCGARRGWCRRCTVWVRHDGGVATRALACKVPIDADLGVQTRAGGPAPSPSLEAAAPAWKNALSQKKVEP